MFLSWNSKKRFGRLLAQATLYEFRKRTVFRTGFLIREILNGITRPLVMIVVYWAICEGNPEKIFQGYRFIDFVQYLLLAATLQKLIFGNRALDLASQIFDGYLTKYFVMPFRYFILALARFFQFVGVQFGVVCIFYLVGTFIFPKWWPKPASWTALGQSLTLVFLGSYCFFLLYFIINSLAFWLELVWTLLVGTWFISGFISGLLIPISLMPTKIQAILYWIFPYWTIFAPVEIFLGKRTDFWQGFSILLGTLVLLEGLRRVVWTRGLKKYTGVGM